MLKRKLSHERVANICIDHCLLCLTQFVRSSGVLLGWPIHHTQHHKLDRGIHNFFCYNSDSSDSWEYDCCQPSEKKKIQFRCAKMCSVRKTKEFANSSLQNNEGRPAHAFKVSQACCDTDKSSWSKCLASLAFKVWWEYLFFLVCFVSNWTNIDTERQRCHPPNNEENYKILQQSWQRRTVLSLLRYINICEVGQ